MEQQNQNEESSLFDLNVEPSILNYLSETARWGKFLSIIGFIACSIMLLAGIIIPVVFNRMGNLGGNNLFGGIGFGFIFFIYVILALIYFFPCFYLLRFSNAIKSALASNDQLQLTEGFKNLKALFKYVGIFTIVILSLYALILVFGGVTAIFNRGVN
jgi:hypothetical protein